MVSEVKVDSTYLWKQMRLAKTLPDSINWFERLVSLRPRNMHYMMALQKAYSVLGDTAKAAFIGRQVRGTNPIYLAHNDGKDILVIGYLDSAGEFTGLLWEEPLTGSVGRKFAPTTNIDQATKRKAVQLNKAFSTMDWFSMGERNRFPIPEKRTIAMPRIVPPQGKTEDYYSHILDMTTFGLSLGAFNDAVLNAREESSIFATSPIYPVPFSGLNRSLGFDSLSWYQKQLVGNAFDSQGVTSLTYRRLFEYDYVEVALGGILPNSRENAEQRGIFNSKRKLIWPPASTTGSDYWHSTSTSKAGPVWFRFGESSAYPAFCILPITNMIHPPEFKMENGEFGYHLLRISKADGKFFVVRLNYSGD